MIPRRAWPLWLVYISAFLAGLGFARLLLSSA